MIEIIKDAVIYVGGSVLLFIIISFIVYKVKEYFSSEEKPYDSIIKEQKLAAEKQAQAMQTQQPKPAAQKPQAPKKHDLPIVKQENVKVVHNTEAVHSEQVRNNPLRKSRSHSKVFEHVLKPANRERFKVINNQQATSRSGSGGRANRPFYHPTTSALEARVARREDVMTGYDKEEGSLKKISFNARGL